MSITKILSAEKVEAEAKLEQVAETVAVARKAYGNEDVKIDAPKVQTAHGVMGFEHLDDDSKVHLLRNEVQNIKAEAVECTEQTPGMNLNKKIEELIATNGYFVNIAAGTKFDYI